MGAKTKEINISKNYKITITFYIFLSKKCKKFLLIFSSF